MDSGGRMIPGNWNKVLFYILFIILPLIAAITPWLLEVKLTSLESYIGTGIAIFTGLFFSLLLNISSKIRIEKENVNKDISNFLAFKENMRQISNITLYIIIIGIQVMIILLLNYLLKIDDFCIERILSSITLFLLIRYFVCLFFMLQRFFFVLRDEINNVL